MQLTAEENAVLEGERGEALRKTMASVVQYGAAFGAQRLVVKKSRPILSNAGHARFVMVMAMAPSVMSTMALAAMVA